MRKCVLVMMVIAMGIMMQATASFGRTLYVATDGNASYSGTQPDSAWTIAKAFTSATAGDTVYIKGGNYGNPNLVVSGTGNQTSPLVFEGYDGMPAIDGVDWNITKTGSTNKGIYMTGKSYVTLRNINVKRYYAGIWLDSSCLYCTLDNCVVDSCANTSTGSDGYGILVQRSKHITVKNCSATDNGGDNYMLSKSDSCLFQNCGAYGTVAASDTLATDYYFVMAWSSDNLIRDSIVDDTIRSGKGNHGFIVKDNPGTSSALKGAHSSNNKFINCTANGFEECFVTAHGCYNTLFDSCSGNNIGKVSGYWDNVFMVRDSAYATTFSNCRAVASANAGGQVACLYDGVEGSGTTKYMQVQRANNFINCTFEGGTRSINLRNTENTTFTNCTFVNSKYMFRFGKNYAGNDSCSGVVLKNCIVSGVDSTYDVSVQGYPWTYSLSTTSAGYDDMVDVSATFTDFWDGFDALPGSGNISDDPLFADQENADLHLKSQGGRWDGEGWTLDSVTSPCIDAGDSTNAYSNEPAPNGGRINMGCYGNTGQASKTKPVSIATGTPAVFSLDQNVPNPFNPSTAITYSIPAQCMVTMTVYNVTGQKVATLVRQTQAAGKYTVRWKPESIASGIFFCRIDAGGHTKTMKLLFIK